MGVLNITPDSFYDGGSLFQGGAPDLDAVLRRAEKMLLEGASILDVGGESTRPGACLVGSQLEQDRVLPIVEAVLERFDTIVSVDTSDPSVMRASADLGAGLINDVRALARDGALEAVASIQLPVCLMHMQGQPLDMQSAPEYQSVVDEVSVFFDQRIKACEQAGVERERIILDPGVGFGKTDAHNIALLRHTRRLVDKRLPVLIGVSRKSMFGRLLGRDVQNRLSGSLAVAYAALSRGANILRVHDVAETLDVIKIFNLMERCE